MQQLSLLLPVLCTLFLLLPLLLHVCRVYRLCQCTTLAGRARTPKTPNADAPFSRVAQYPVQRPLIIVMLLLLLLLLGRS
jgi:hypothetical protein